ncbi:MAG: outer membrane beta-barrel protein [Candidatus Eisenbacteria bacterium]|uniref:Outer membrane beta-barrel protein n=1 Tax=Eiseniibacteriota bacterium TaxID=2212470 RepID=A0A7Y2E607_UNCEI|nr:outer membrane beta-barrel protein [Candidatus Eisenbacteria bacterium]
MRSRFVTDLVIAATVIVLTTLALSVAIDGLINSAHAQTMSPLGSNVGLHVGYSQDSGAEDGNGLVGGHLELMPTTWLGLRGSVDFRNVRSVDVLLNGSNESQFDVRSVPVAVEGRFYLPSGKIAPFAAVGAGWYFLKYDYSESLELLGFEDEWTDTFGWHAGLGTAVALSPAVSAFGEVRAVFMNTDRALNDELGEDLEDLDYDSTYFSGGLNFKF